MTIRVTVWGDNVHEQKNKVVAQVYPATMHGTIAAALNREDGITASTVTLQDPDHGMTAEKLALPPDRLIGFEDALPGARSAKGAGLFTVAIGPEATSPDFAFCDLQAADYPDLRQQLGM